MDHMLSRSEGQRVRYVREWRSVDVQQPSASSLMTLSGALLLTGLAVGVLVLIVIAGLPLLVLGALAWTARRWLPRAPRIGRGKVPIRGFGLRGQAFAPLGRRMRLPLAHDAGRSGGTAHDRRVVG